MGHPHGRGGALLSAPPLTAHALLPAPPSEDSATTRESWLTAAYPADAALARTGWPAPKPMLAEENVFAFSTVLARNLPPSSFPLATQLFDRLMQTEKAAVREAKDYWHRQRPYALDPTLTPVRMPAMAPIERPRHRGLHGWPHCWRRCCPSATTPSLNVPRLCAQPARMRRATTQAMWSRKNSGHGAGGAPATRPGPRDADRCGHPRAATRLQSSCRTLK